MKNLLSKSSIYFVFYAYAFIVAWEDAILIPGVGTLSKVIFLVQLFLIFMLCATKNITFNSKQTLLPFVFLVYVYFTTIISNEGVSENSQLRLFQYSLLVFQFYVLSSFIRNREQLDGIIKWSTYGGVFLSFLQLMSYLFIEQKIYARTTVGLFDPNDIALICCLSFVMAIYLRNRNIISAYKLYFLAGLLCVGILLSGSRTGIVALIITLFYLFVSSKNYKSVERIFIISFAVIGVILFINYMPENIASRLFTVTEELSSSDFSDRSILWKFALDLFNQSPFIGVGAGNYKELSVIFFGYERSPHNVYLSILSENGLIGVVIFFSILFIPFLKVIVRGVRIDINFFAMLLFVLLVAFASLNWEWRKQTWLIIYMLNALAFLRDGNEKVNTCKL